MNGRSPYYGYDSTGRAQAGFRGIRLVNVWFVGEFQESGKGETKMVTLNDARRIIAAAEKKANEIGQPMNVAVADAGGNLIAHIRMDGAWLGSIDISIKKAYTSRAFDIATKDLATHSQSGGQFFGIHASNDGRIMIFAGGIPLKQDGKVVGAVGVSGGSGEQDHAVAEAGAAAL
jgi:uncharacterized protein GlcG (DUF336 family)